MPVVSAVLKIEASFMGIIGKALSYVSMLVVYHTTTLTVEVYGIYVGLASILCSILANNVVPALVVSVIRYCYSYP